MKREPWLVVAARSRIHIQRIDGRWRGTFDDGRWVSFPTFRGLVEWGRGLCLMFEREP